MYHNTVYWWGLTHITRRWWDHNRHITSCGPGHEMVDIWNALKTLPHTYNDRDHWRTHRRSMIMSSQSFYRYNRWIIFGTKNWVQWTPPHVNPFSFSTLVNFIQFDYCHLFWHHKSVKLLVKCTFQKIYLPLQSPAEWKSMFSDCPV